MGRRASVHSTTGNRGVRISSSNAGYTMFQGSVKGTGYPLHSPVSPSLPFPCVTVCHHISTGVYLNKVSVRQREREREKERERERRRSISFKGACQLLRLCSFDARWMLYEMSINIMSGFTVTGEQYLKKNLSQCHFIHHKSHMYWPLCEADPSRWGAGDEPRET